MFVYLLHDAKEFWLAFLGNGKKIEAPFELKKKTHTFLKYKEISMRSMNLINKSEQNYKNARPG